jgi:hypothetical protein
MSDYFKKKYDELLASVFDPLFTRFLELSWLKRAALVLAIPLTWTLWETRSQISEHFLVLNQARKILLSANNKIPISSDLKLQIISLAERLRTASANDVALMAPIELTGWSAAQAVLAVGEDPKFLATRTLFVDYLRKRKINSCGCWAELNQEGPEKAWIFISGWALAALAVDRHPATSQEIDFILQNQQANGAWLPTTDALNDFASVYTTAWSLIGLHAQLNANLLDKETANRATSAISRGATWLLSTRLSGTGWKPYPMQSSSNTSPTISALALHALTRVSVSGIENLQRDWLKSLPATPIPSSIGENLYVEIRSQVGVKNIDHFVYITLPWMLIGAVEAFPSGSVMDRAKAVQWFESQISNTGLLNSDAETKHWWRADFSIGVNHLVNSISTP